MSDAVVAWLRTVVPALWSAAVAFVLTRIPALQPLVDALGPAFADVVLVPVVLAAYKLALAKLEPLLPAWLARIFAGSALTPKYRPAQ